MTSRMLRFGAGALAVLPGAAIALGLGPIEVRSSLDQPLSARIPVLAAEADQLDKLAAGLASREHFETVGVEHSPILSQLSFELVRPEGARPYIVVQSKAPIREPLLDILVEVNWPGGALLREYSLFLDPPGRATRYAKSTPAPSPVSTQAPTRSRPAATRPARTGTISGNTYGPVGAGETLWSIAEQVRPDRGISIQQMMLAILEANPDAFWANNVNSLNKGTVLRIPTREEALVRTASEAVAESSRQWAEWQANPSPYVQVAQAAPTPEAVSDLEAEVADVPLHQLLLVPAGEEEVEPEESTELEVEGDVATATASSETVPDGLGVDVESQALVRVENGGLGLKLAGLDQLSERLPTIVAVDNSVLATGAVAQVVDGRLGQTVTEQTVTEMPAEPVEESAAPVAETLEGQLGQSAEAELAVEGSVIGEAESLPVEEAGFADVAEEAGTVTAEQTAESQASSPTRVVDAPPVVEPQAEPLQSAAEDGPQLPVLEGEVDAEVTEVSVAEPTAAVQETGAANAEPGILETMESETSGAPETLESVESPTAISTPSDVQESVSAQENLPPTEEIGVADNSGAPQAVADLDAASDAVSPTESISSSSVEISAEPDAQTGAPPAEQVETAGQAAEPDAVESALPPAVLGILALLKEPRNLTMAGGVAILFLLLLILVIRRGSKSKEVEEDRQPSGRREAAPAARAEEGAQTEDDTQVDPSRQADVLIAVGNFSEASRIVAEAIATNPDDESLAFKQLEVDYAAHDTDAFSAHATEHQPRLEMSGLWPNVVAMGVVLCPDHPLFSVNGQAEAIVEHSNLSSRSDLETETSELTDAESPAIQELASMGSESASDRKEPTFGELDASSEPSDDRGLEFDLPASPEDVVEQADSALDLTATTGTLDESDEQAFFSPIRSDAEESGGGLDLSEALEAEFEKLEMEGLDDLEEEDLDLPAEQSNDVAAQSNTLEFEDFERADTAGKAFSGEREANIDEPAESTNEPEETIAELAEGLGWHADDGFLRKPQEEDSEPTTVSFGDVGGGDEADSTFVDTKLDLAAAYLELGDDAGARTLYQEVLSEGNNDQRRLADEALRKLA